MNENKKLTPEEIWDKHVAILEFVDMVEHAGIRHKIKSKILDVAHEIKKQLEEN